MAGFLKRLFGGSTGAAKEAKPSAQTIGMPSTTPDAGIHFGFKTGWIVVPSHDPEAVLAALGCADIAPCNWRSGLGAVDRKTGPLSVMFATPPKDGMVCVVVGLQAALDHPDAIADMRALLERLSTTFGSAAYFGSYRVVCYVAWAFAREGRLQRLFSFVDGEEPVVIGEAVAPEVAVGLPFEEGEAAEASLAALFGEDEAAVYPTEEVPMLVCAAHGIDPQSFAGLELGLGRLARIEGGGRAG